MNGSTLSTPPVTTYTYDAVGNKSSETLPDGELTTYSYDGLNRLKTVLEQQGTTTLFSQSFILNSDGTRHSVHETQLQPDSSTTTSDTTWNYDADSRLTGEVVTSSVAADSYANVFSYDLSGNRTKEVHTGPGGGANETTTSTYNSDDQLTQTVSTLNGTTTNTYDANGSLTTSTNGSNVTTYSYDSRNKMTSFSGGGTTATYVYDDSGQRVQETVNGTTTLYLTDTNNPTGYAQPIQERSTATSAPSTTYLIGDRIYAQIASTASTPAYLLIDGHGSTRLMTDASGNVIKAFTFDGFGGAIGAGFSLATAGTPFLFGGDAVYDPASGLYLHGDGIRGREGPNFIEEDPQRNGNNSDPISLHKYLYVNANPVMGYDPTGHFDGFAGIITTIGLISAGQGLLAGVTAHYLNPHATFWDSFFRGSISTGVTDLLGVFTDLPPVVTIPVGNVTADLIVDLWQGNYSTKGKFAVAFAHLLVDAVVGVAAGAILGTSFQAIDSADSISIFNIVINTPRGAGVRAAIDEIYKISAASSVQNLIGGGLGELVDYLVDGIKGIKHLQDEHNSQMAN